VPGRVEGDVVELEPIFVRGDGHPPDAERFARVGYDPARLFGRADETHRQEGAACSVRCSG
jgi:pilus assembly protein CpaF